MSYTEINDQNYLPYCKGLNVAAEALDEYSMRSQKRLATRIRKHVVCDPCSLDHSGLKRIGVTPDRAIVQIWNLDGEVSHEFVIVGSDGNCYELEEAKSVDVVKSHDEIYSLAEEIRFKRDEYSSKSDYWEDQEAAEGDDLWEPRDWEDNGGSEVS